jgi:hypothetical protein
MFPLLMNDVKTRILTDTLAARHEREAKRYRRRRCLPAVQRVHLLRCRSGAPSLPVAREDVSWTSARCNTFGMAFTLRVEWKHQELDAAHIAKRPSKASAKGACRDEDEIRPRP